MKFPRFTLLAGLLLSVSRLLFGGSPPGLVPDRTAVRPGEPVSFRLTLSTASPTVVIGANDMENSRWFAVHADGSTVADVAPPWNDPTNHSVAAPGETGVFSRLFTNQVPVSGSFSPRAVPIQVTAKNSSGASDPVEIWVGPQPDPASGPGAWINRTGASYALIRTTREWSTTTDGDDNTEWLYDSTEVTTETVPPDGVFWINNTIESAEDGSWQIGHSEDVSLVVDPGQLFAPLTLNRSVVSDSSVTLVWPAATGGAQPTDCVVYRDGLPVGTTTALTFTDTGLTAGTTYTYTIKSRKTGSPLSPAGPALIVTTAPVTILTQPADRVLAAGSTTIFTVTASGPPPLSFQWRKNDVPLPGQTGPSLTLAGVTDNDTARYTVVVTSAAGSATSAGATLSVNSVRPEIASVGPITGTVGAPLALTIPATNFPSAYYRLTGYFPEGVALQATTGLIFGVPTTAGTFTALVAAGNSGGMARATVTFVIAPAPPQAVQAIRPGEARVTAQGSDLNRPPFRIQVGNVGSTVTAANGDTATNYIKEVSVSVDGDPGYWRLAVNAPTLDLVFTDALSSHYNGVSRTGYRVAVRWSDFRAWSSTGEDDDGNEVQLSGIDELNSVLYDEPFPRPAPVPRVPNPLVITFPYPANHGFDDGPFTIFADGTGYDFAPVIFVVESGPARIAYVRVLNGIESVAQIVPTGVGQVTVTAYAPGESGYTSAVPVSRTFHILATPPVITRQPASLAVTAGATATLSVAATGAPPLTYRWHRGYGAETTLPGAVSTTTSTLVFPHVDVEARGDYWVEVSGPGGTSASLPATLTVNPPPPPPRPTITSAATVTATVNAPFVYSFTTDVPASSYVWDAGGLPLGVSPLGAGQLLQGTPTQPGNFVLTFRAWGVSGVGPAFTLTINVVNGAGQAVPTINTQPLSRIVDAGATVVFSVAASGPGSLSYQWYRNGDLLFGQRLSSLVLGSVSAADVGNYSVRVSSAAGATLSNVVQLIVNGAPPPGPVVPGTLPVITSQPQDAAVPAGQSVSFGVVATSPSGTPLSYQWLRNGTVIEGATTNSFSIPQTSYASNGHLYSVVVSNATGAITSAEAQLLVTGPVLAVSQLRPNSFRLTWTSETSGGNGVSYRVVIPDLLDTANATQPFDVLGLAPATPYAVEVHASDSTTGTVFRSVPLRITTPAASVIAPLTAKNSAKVGQRAAFATSQPTVRTLTTAASAPAPLPSQWLDVWVWQKPNRTWIKTPDGILDEVMELDDPGRNSVISITGVVQNFTYTVIPGYISVPFTLIWARDPTDYTRGTYKDISDPTDPTTNYTGPVDIVTSGPTVFTHVETYYTGHAEFELEAGYDYGVYSMTNGNDANDPSKWGFEGSPTPIAGTTRSRLVMPEIQPPTKKQYRLVKYGFAPGGCVLRLPGMGATGLGGVGVVAGKNDPDPSLVGTLKLPNGMVITASTNGTASSTTVTYPTGVGTATASASVDSNGVVVKGSLPAAIGVTNSRGGITLTGGIDVTLANGQLTVTGTAGASVSVAGKAISLVLPPGLATDLRSLIGAMLNSIGGVLGANGNPMKTKVDNGDGVWRDPDDANLGSVSTGETRNVRIGATDADNRAPQPQNIITIRFEPRAPTVAPALRSRDRFLTGSFDASIDRVRTGLIEFITATGQVLGGYKLDGSTGTHIYDSQDEILSDGELDAVVAGSFTASTPRMNQQVVFWRSSPGSSTIRFSTVFPEVGEIKIRITGGSGDPTEIPYTLTAEPNFGGLLEHLGQRITSIQMPAVAPWSLLPPIDGIDDDEPPIAAAAAAAKTGGRVAALRAASYSTGPSTGQYAVLSGAPNNFLAKVATYADQAVALADLAGIGSFKVGGGFIKGFIDGFHDGVTSDVEGAQALADMIAFSFVGDFTRVKAMVDGIKALIAKVNTPGGPSELFDQMLGKIVDKAQVSVPWDSVGDNTDQWGERAYVIGYAGGFVTEQIVTTMVTGGLITKAGQGVKIALSGAKTALITPAMVSAVKKFTTASFVSATKHVKNFGTPAVRSIRKALAEVAAQQVAGLTVAEYCTVLVNRLGTEGVTWERIAENAYVLCVNEAEVLRIGISLHPQMAKLQATLGSALSKSATEGFFKLWPRLGPQGMVGECAHLLFESPLSQPQMVRLLEIADGSITSLTQATGGWLLHRFPRGFFFEELVHRIIGGLRLAPGFRTIDVWKSAEGLVISIKSLDVTAQTYQTISDLTYTVNRYVDLVSTYPGQITLYGGVTILPNQIALRQVQLVIRPGASAAQLDALTAAVQRAASLPQPVNLVIREIP